MLDLKPPVAPPLPTASAVRAVASMARSIKQSRMTLRPLHVPLAACQATRAYVHYLVELGTHASDASVVDFLARCERCHDEQVPWAVDEDADRAALARLVALLPALEGLADRRRS